MQRLQTRCGLPQRRNQTEARLQARETRVSVRWLYTSRQRKYSPTISCSISTAFKAGWVLNRLATKAMFSLELPFTTSFGVTNSLQPSRSADCSIVSALAKLLEAWRKTRQSVQQGQKTIVLVSKLCGTLKVPFKVWKHHTSKGKYHKAKNYAKIQENLKHEDHE